MSSEKNKVCTRSPVIQQRYSLFHGRTRFVDTVGIASRSSCGLSLDYQLSERGRCGVLDGVVMRERSCDPGLIICGESRTFMSATIALLEGNSSSFYRPQP